MMANRSDLGWPNPKRLLHFECVKAMGSQPANPIRDSGMRPQTKSGCTGAICYLMPSRNERLASRGRPCTVVRHRNRALVDHLPRRARCCADRATRGRRRFCSVRRARRAAVRVCFVASLCVMPRGGIGSIRLKAKEAPRRIRSKLNFKVINSMP